MPGIKPGRMKSTAQLRASGGYSAGLASALEAAAAAALSAFSAAAFFSTAYTAQIEPS
jgi:hypothetical protein